MASPRIPRKPLPKAPGGVSPERQQLSVRELADEINARGNDGRQSQDENIEPALEFARLSLSSESPDEEPHEIPRSSLDKPLPILPQQSHNYHLGDPGARRRNSLGKLPGPDVSGVLDLRNTEDTEIQKHYAPAVVHENIIEHVHEIREERITREIHNHDVYHRILPIKDIEVLPARHFVKGEDGQTSEVPAHQLPGREVDYTQRLLEAVFKDPLTHHRDGGTAKPGPRQFTARKFDDNDDKPIERQASGRPPLTETRWIHPPTLADNPDAVPFHFGSADPRDDGFRRASKIPQASLHEPV